jgi:hypothetical protein
MSDLKGVDDRTAAVALTGLFNSLADHRETAEERAIRLRNAKTMAETLGSPPDNFQRDQNQTPPTSGNAGDPPHRGTGWVDARPIESPPGQDLIRRMVDRLEPQSPEWILRNANLTPEQKEELRRRIAADPAKLGWIGELLDRMG